MFISGHFGLRFIGLFNSMMPETQVVRFSNNQLRWLLRGVWGGGGEADGVEELAGFGGVVAVELNGFAVAEVEVKVLAFEPGGEEFGRVNDVALEHDDFVQNCPFNVFFQPARNR